MLLELVAKRGEFADGLRDRLRPFGRLFRTYADHGYPEGPQTRCGSVETENGLFDDADVVDTPDAPDRVLRQLHVVLRGDGAHVLRRDADLLGYLLDAIPGG